MPLRISFFFPLVVSCTDSAVTLEFKKILKFETYAWKVECNNYFVKSFTKGSVKTINVNDFTNNRTMLPYLKSITYYYSSKLTNTPGNKDFRLTYWFPSGAKLKYCTMRGRLAGVTNVL